MKTALALALVIAIGIILILSLELAEQAEQIRQDTMWLDQIERRVNNAQATADYTQEQCFDLLYPSV